MMTWKDKGLEGGPVLCEGTAQASRVHNLAVPWLGPYAYPRRQPRITLST